MAIHLSPSSVATLRRCALQFFFSAICRIKLKPSLKMATGTAVHFSELQVNFAQKIQTGEDLPLDTIQDAAAQSFEEEAKEAILKEDEDPGKGKDRTVAAVTVYHKRVAPQIQPILVERPLPVKLGDIEVVQFADVLTADEEIRDIKVESRSTPTANLGGSLQLNSYALGYVQLTGQTPKAIQLDQVLPDLKDEKKRYNPMRSDRPNPESAAAIYCAAASLVARIKEEPQNWVIPADPTSPATPCSWCGYAKGMCSVADPNARIPWTRFLGPDGIELAQAEAARVIAENLDRRPSTSNRNYDEETI